MRTAMTSSGMVGIGIRGIGMALALGGTALAHSKSEVTVPADGATVTAVETIEMRFDAPMRVTAVKLMRDGTEVGVDRETGMEPAKAFRAAPASDLTPGPYRVEWRGLSDDGHVMQGSFGFTVGE